MKTYILITDTVNIPCFGKRQLDRTIARVSGTCYWEIKDPTKTNGVYVSVRGTTVFL